MPELYRTVWAQTFTIAFAREGNLADAVNDANVAARLAVVYYDHKAENDAIDAANRANP